MYPRFCFFEINDALMGVHRWNGVNIIVILNEVRIGDFMFKESSEEERCGCDSVIGVSLSDGGYLMGVFHLILPEHRGAYKNV